MTLRNAEEEGNAHLVQKGWISNRNIYRFPQILWNLVGFLQVVMYEVVSQ